jgi:hypothetical protein
MQERTEEVIVCVCECVCGEEVNIFPGQGQATSVRDSQSHDDPLKSHYLSDSSLSLTFAWREASLNVLCRPACNRKQQGHWFFLSAPRAFWMNTAPALPYCDNGVAILRYSQQTFSRIWQQWCLMFIHHNHELNPGWKFRKTPEDSHGFSPPHVTLLYSSELLQTPVPTLTSPAEHLFFGTFRSEGPWKVSIGYIHISWLKNWTFWVCYYSHWQFSHERDGFTASWPLCSTGRYKIQGVAEPHDPGAWGQQTSCTEHSVFLHPLSAIHFCFVSQRSASTKRCYNIWVVEQ